MCCCKRIEAGGGSEFGILEFGTEINNLLDEFASADIADKLEHLNEFRLIHIDIELGPAFSLITA